MIILALAVLITLYSFRPRAKRWIVRYESPRVPETLVKIEYKNEEHAQAMARFMTTVGFRYVSIKEE